MNRDLTGVSEWQELIEDGMLQLANQTYPCGSNLQISPNVLKDMVTRGEKEEVCARVCVVFDLYCVCHCLCVCEQCDVTLALCDSQCCVCMQLCVCVWC